MSRLGALLGPPPIPREHGAWAMLAIPLVLGLAEAGAVRAASLLVLPAMLLLHLARAASVPALGRSIAGRRLASGHLTRHLLWTGICLGGALACSMAALALAEPAARAAMGYAAIAPVGLGLTHAALGLAGLDRTLSAELLGMTGLAAAALLAAAASGAPLDGRAVGAGALALVYFLSSLSFVRAYRRIKSQGSIAIGSCVGVHVALLLLVTVLLAVGWLPAASLLAFVPIAARTAWGLHRPPRDLRILGWREVVVSILFLTVAALAIERSC